MAQCDLCDNPAIGTYTCPAWEILRNLCADCSCKDCELVHHLNANDNAILDADFIKIHDSLVNSAAIPILNDEFLSSTCPTCGAKILNGKKCACTKTKSKAKKYKTIIVKSLAGTGTKYLQGQIRVVPPVFRIQLGLDFNYNRPYGAAIQEDKIKSDSDLQILKELYKQTFKLSSFHIGSTEKYGKVYIRPDEDKIKWQVPVFSPTTNILGKYHLKNDDYQKQSYWSFTTENIFSEVFKIFELLKGKL